MSIHTKSVRNFSLVSSIVFAVVTIVSVGLFNLAPHTALSASNLVVAYNFDNATSTALADYSGNNNNGTLVNGPVWATGRYSGGLSFDGINDYVTAGNIAALNGNTAVTYSAWIKTTATAEKHIINKSGCFGTTNDGPAELGINFFTSGKADFLIYKAGGSPNYYNVISSANVNDGAWHYVVGTYDGATLRIYVDGIDSGSVAAPNVTLTTTANDVRIGDCSSYYLNGSIDDVRIYNRALTASEVVSDMSTPVDGTPPPPDTTAPSTPAGLTATPASATSINLLWTVSTDNVSVAGYKVFRGGVQIATTTVVSFANTGLTASTSYSYYVIAFDLSGNQSGASLTATAVTPSAPDTTVPSTPSALIATGVSATQINLSWTASTDNVGVTGYRIYRCTGTTCTATTQAGTSVSTSYQDTGLAASTSYNYRVRAVDAAGNLSAYSSAKSSKTLTALDTTIPVVTLSAPVNNATVVGAAVTVSATASDNVGVVGVQFTLDGVNLGTEDITSPYSISWNTTTATNGTHVVAAVARDAAGNFATAASRSVTVANPIPDTTAPTVPQNVVATATSQTQVTLSWSASSDNVAVTGYKVFRGGVQIATTTAVGFVNTGLVAGTAYSYTVSAYDAVGNVSAQSVAVLVTTQSPPPPDTTSPSIPQNVFATATSQTQVVVSWTAATDNVGVTGYNVMRDGVLIATTTTLSFINNGLFPASTYLYTVTAYDAAGNVSTQSAGASVTTQSPPPPDTLAPTAPTNLTLTVISSSEIDLVWGISADNIGVTGYQVFRNGTFIATTTTSSFNNLGLTASTTYNYAVLAYDAAGNISTLSVSVGATTQGTVGVLTGLDFPGNTSTTSVRFAFTDPQNIGLPQYGPNGNGITYIWKIYPRQQGGYYTTFFWGPGGAFTGTSYYGAHPYPDGGGSNTQTHKWEISAQGGDFVADANGNNTSLGYNQWYTQALRVWKDASGLKHHEFYWNLPDTSKVISLTSDASYGEILPVNPALTFGDAPWNQSKEMLNGVLRGIQIYNTNLSLSDIQSEINSPLSVPAGSANIWYMNINPTPTDISDKSGKGHHPAWQTTNRPTLYATSDSPDTTAPTAPTNLASSLTTSSQTQLNWTASTDNIAVSGYKVFRGGVQIATTTVTNYTNTGLTASTSYSYTVSAYDAAGNASLVSTPVTVTTLGTQTAPSGLVAAYNFDQTPSLVLTDLSGNSNNGNLKNGVLWGSGKNSGGLSFDGSDDYVTASNTALNNISGNNLSIEFWAKPMTGGSGGDNSIIDKPWFPSMMGSPYYQYGVEYQVGNHDFVLLLGTAAGQQEFHMGAGSAYGTWAHVAFTYDGANVRGYMNGVLQITQPATFALTARGNDLRFGIDGGYGQPFRGFLDDVRIYNRPLAPVEVQTDMNTPVGGTAVPDTTAPTAPTGLVAIPVSSSQVSLSWTSSTDNLAVSGYTIYRNSVLVSTTSATNKYDSGLIASTSYSYTVSAYDAAGNTSQVSAATVATTLGIGQLLTYSTNFDANENPVSEGGKWNHTANIFTNVVSQDGLAYGTNGVTNTYDDSYALLSGFGADQSAQATIVRSPLLATGITHEAEILLRFSDDAGSARGYECLFSYAGGTQLARWNGTIGDYTILYGTSPASLNRELATGDVIKCSITGNVIRQYINGLLVDQVTDTAIVTGQPGMGFFTRPGGNSAHLAITDYSASTVTSGPLTAYSTNFDLTESPISEGGLWSRANNIWTNVVTAGGIAHGTNGVTNTYDDSYALLPGTFGPDQTAQATIYRDPSLASSSPMEVELLLRFSDDAGNARGYECLFNAYGGFDIARWNGAFGSVNSLPFTQSGFLGRPLVTGDVVKATIIGNVITTYVNGVLMARATDSTFATGRPGISFFTTPTAGNPALLGFTSYSVNAQ